MDKKFGGVIWTNHAIQRMLERGIKQGDAWTAWKNPDQSRFAKAKNTWIYYKTYGNETIEVAAKKNDAGEWIILSVWSRRERVKLKRENKSFWNLIKNLFK